MDNRIRTMPIKPFVIFLSVILLVSIGAIILFVFLKDELMVIRVLVWVMCGIFTVISMIVLFNQLFDYVEVKDEMITKHVMFAKHSYPIEKIDKVVNKEGIYYVYVKNVKVIAFAGDTKEGYLIASYLDRKGVKVGW